MNNHLVSIITPTYNSYEFSKQTIKSVLNQTYTNWELLITDDFSTDGSYLKLRKEFNDSRIKFFQLAKNSGPAYARNNSIKKSSGKYIAFIDGDDTWNKNKLSEQIRFMEEKNLSFTFSSYSIIDEKNNVIGEVTCKNPVNYKIMLRNNYIGCLTAMYDAEKLGKIYMPIIKKRQDWALWLRILRITENAYPINKKLANYRITSQSVSSNKIDLLKYTWKIYYKVEKLSIFEASYRFCLFFYFYIKKKYFKH